MNRSKMEYITKKEFCDATHSNPNGWLFRHEKEHPIEFRKEETDEGPIYHTFQGAEHRKFKDMPQYGEIWHCMAEDTPFWGLTTWSVWTQYG